MAQKYDKRKHARGKPLKYNAGLMSKYEAELRGLVRRMARDCNKQIMQLFNAPLADNFFEDQKTLATFDASLASQARILMNKLTKDYTNLFDSKALDLSKLMVSKSDKLSKKNLKNSFKGVIEGFTVAQDFIPDALKEVAKSVVHENVSLIKTIPDIYFRNITGSVMRSISTGSGVNELKNDLMKYYGESERKAKNVALDQTRKAYNSINKQRMMSAGLNTFEWLHSGGGLTPRKEHIALNGKVFSFDNLPIIVPATGERGIPGQAINCGCTMRPIYVFPEGEEE